MALLREDQSFPLLDSSAYTMVHVNTPSGEFVRISCISVVGWTAPISALYRAMLEDLRRVPGRSPTLYLHSVPCPESGGIPAQLDDTSGLPCILAAGQCHPISPDTSFLLTF